MPSARETALTGLRTALESAAAAVVLPAGITGQPLVLHDEPEPEVLHEAGQIVMAEGEPGAPEVTLSPPVYAYSHGVTVEVTIEHLDRDTRRDAIDAVLQAVQAAIDADDTLGGAVDMAETSAADSFADTEEGSTPYARAEFTVILDYETTAPLS